MHYVEMWRTATLRLDVTACRISHECLNMNKNIVFLFSYAQPHPPLSPLILWAANIAPYLLNPNLSTKYHSLFQTLTICTPLYV